MKRVKTEREKSERFDRWVSDSAYTIKYENPICACQDRPARRMDCPGCPVAEITEAENLPKGLWQHLPGAG